MQLRINDREYDVPQKGPRPHVQGTGLMLLNSLGEPIGRIDHITVIRKNIHFKYVQVLPIESLPDPINTAGRFLAVPKLGLTQRSLEHTQKPQEIATFKLAFILRQVERLLRKNQGKPIEIDEKKTQISFFAATRGITIHSPERGEFSIEYQHKFENPNGRNNPPTWHVRVKELALQSYSAKNSITFQIRPKPVIIPGRGGLFEVRLLNDTDSKSSADLGRGGVFDQGVWNNPSNDLLNNPGVDIGDSEMDLLNRVYDILHGVSTEQKKKNLELTRALLKSQGH